MKFKIGSFTTDADHGVVMSIISYSFCSSMMLVINKMLVTAVPMASAITFLQLALAVVIVAGGCVFRVIDMKFPDDLRVDPAIAKSFALYALLFVAGLYANMAALETVSVETIIVLRSLLPLFVAYLEWQFMGRAIPNQRSLLSLSAVVLGSILYVMSQSSATKIDETKSGLLAQAWDIRWALAWFVIIAFNMTYGKVICNTVKLSMWGNVYYNNLIAAPMMLPLLFGTGEWKLMHTTFSSLSPMFYLWLSSIMGVAIGYCSWWCRGSVSATSFTVIGVLNKFFTIGVNSLVNPKARVSFFGFLALSICLVAGAFYQQSPMRSEEKPISIPVDYKDEGSDIHLEKIVSDESRRSSMARNGPQSPQGTNHRKSIH